MTTMLKEVWVLGVPLGAREGMRFVGPFDSRDEAAEYDPDGIYILLSPPERNHR